MWAKVCEPGWGRSWIHLPPVPKRRYSCNNPLNIPFSESPHLTQRRAELGCSRNTYTQNLNVCLNGTEDMSLGVFFSPSQTIQELDKKASWTAEQHERQCTRGEVEEEDPSAVMVGPPGKNLH